MASRRLLHGDWATARRISVAGDASGRRYSRLLAPGRSAILMEDGGDIAPFLRAARHLRHIGLSVPEILAADPATGRILMEDFGDAVFARLIAADPGRETPLYAAAIDLLVALHRHAAPDWAQRNDPGRMVDALAPLWSEHAGGADPALAAETGAIFQRLLSRHAPATDVLLHRDFHAENLVWLAGRGGGIESVGLLDFQDALAGHRAYDLASLLQDARRDVPPRVEEAMIERYLSATGVPEIAFRRAYALQSLQRQLRILGIFARLSKAGRPGYGRLVPRVLAHVARCLDHPVTAPLRGPVSRVLPETVS